VQRQSLCPPEAICGFSSDHSKKDFYFGVAMLSGDGVHRRAALTKVFFASFFSEKRRVFLYSLL
jgi:hypothetical protein